MKSQDITLFAAKAFLRTDFAMGMGENRRKAVKIVHCTIHSKC